jgi:hypothetical protein
MMSDRPCLLWHQGRRAYQGMVDSRSLGCPFLSGQVYLPGTVLAQALASIKALVRNTDTKSNERKEQSKADSVTGWGLHQREGCNHLSHGAPGSSPLRRHLAYGTRWIRSCLERIVRGGRRSGTVVGFLLTLAVAHTAQALPHFPCWFWEPRAEYSAETGSTLRRFIASAFSNRAGEYGA